MAYRRTVYKISETIIAIYRGDLMSKLTEKLERLGEDSGLQIGFSTSSTPNQTPTDLMLITQIAFKELERKSSLSKNTTDALIVSVDTHETPHFNRISELVGDHIWGVRSNSIDSNDLDIIYKSNCDFVVFYPDHTSAEIINNDDIGKIVAVNHKVTDEDARAINELPIDGVLFSATETSIPFTVQNLMEIQVIQGLVDKPFMISVTSSIQSQDLKSLHKIGIASIVIESSTPKIVRRIQTDIEKLPKQKNRSKAKGALVASPVTGFEMPVGEEYEDF